MTGTGTLALTPGTVTDTDMATGAGVQSTKLKHQRIITTNFGFVIGDTPTTKEVIVYQAKGTVTVQGFYASLNVDGSSTSIAFDLKKNGTTILTGAVTVTHSTGDRVSVAGTIASASLVADDILSISMTVTSSTGASGANASVVLINEAPQS